MAIDSSHQLQHYFANAIRDPAGNHNSNVNFDQRRLQVYQSLFFNNFEGFCGNGFPVIKSILPEELWLQLVRECFQHQMHSPHFVDIPEAFLTFLSTQSVQTERMPWLMYLAHYEWLELKCAIASNTATHNSEKSAGWYVPESTVAVQYPYPVHRISKSSVDEIETEQTNLLLYRNDSDRVVFLETDPLTVLLIQTLQQGPGLSTEQLIETLVQQLSHISSQHIVEFIERALTSLAGLGIVYSA